MFQDVVVELKNGATIRSNSKDLKAGDFVAIHNKDGEEMYYWDAKEWQEDPVTVMGAILVAASVIDNQYK